MPKGKANKIKILARPEGKRFAKPPTRFVEDGEDAKASAKRGAAETPGKEERERQKREAGPEATPLDKARKKGHGEVLEEHELEKDPVEEDVQGGDIDQETDVNKLLQGGQLICGKDGVEELCGTCGKVKGKDCEGHMVQGVPENGGEKASGKVEGKEYEGHMAEDEQGVPGSGGEKASGEQGRKEADNGGMMDRKEEELQGAAMEESAEKGSQGEKKVVKLAKGQCCQCRNNGTCVQCACVQAGRRCLESCTGQVWQQRGHVEEGSERR